MAQTSASPEPDVYDEGTVWDDQIGGDAFAGFDVPRRRITGRAAAPRETRQPSPPAAKTIPAPPAEPERSERQPEAPTPGGGVPGRRTVTIRGYGAERNLWVSGQSRRRRPEPMHQRAGFKADRMALWAVLLGIVLVVVAAASAHAAVLAHAIH